ncbi:acetyl-CoA carboxylase biotin carboxyl carrier protein subunit [Leucobacter chinensis]|uniref:acetyl-CoA carboxylase biotin carboxyl carrier protein subunit n=1 Tax=Leucobacter chinensis TaxID=2851010 RepID=UPI001C21B677|nr:acetyl-CoA carboxylase biotin carboxyl carrier protein subunit [Leucobacter chinensis]
MQYIHSELTGSVWKILVQAGDTVAAEQEVMILESMKMEIPVVATGSGTVVALEVAESQAVNTGDLLMTIEGA